ncbi:tyrosine-type recombinase/integrase [Candidatus Enterococcus leclercqii]|uniref:tyrosine-type recombinase/integrase n=1 Tax=Candidatus Enterococcus leclercqii TaxID=1857218 RepID=UPI00137973B1|nr:site-specific integrase [Enterococcus sp. CU9D]KAF1291088.1 recombinase [Enterococcus sp. CU9D]
MWIEKRANGKYRYSERYEDPYTGKLKRVSITFDNKTRQTQKDAQYALNNKIADAMNQIQLKKPNITLKQLYDEWYEVYKQQVAEGTYYPTKDMLKAPLKDIGHDAIVNKIDYVLLNKILDGYVYEKELSNSYVSTIKSKLNQMMKYAVRQGYIINNPIEKVEINFKRNTGGQKIKDKFLEDDEYKQLIAYTEKANSRYALLFQWLYLTGMRAGEGTALQKSDVVQQEDGEWIAKVDGTMLAKGRKVHEMAKSNMPKTAAGVRDVILSSKAVEIYQKQLEMNPEGSFLFQTSHGTPFQLQAVNSFLRNHKVRMGFSEDKPLSSHIFRHTHISKLAEIGVPMYVIQDRVGHEDSKITQQIYLHVTKKTKEKLATNLELL